MNDHNTASAGKCPFSTSAQVHKVVNTANQRWWPNQLNLKVLQQNSVLSSPMGEDFNYIEDFNKPDLNDLQRDNNILMTTPQDWWPADYGHYGPFFIRMAWHSAGTYRIGDGRGGAGSGAQRFAPLNSWPDNVNLDKARLLLLPIKQKYGCKISWADLIVFAGNCALESMGFKTLGFAGGRADVWEPEEDLYWGSEDKWLDDQRYSGERQLENPLAAVQMGLIYVNPEGPNGNADPLAAAHDIRETFRRMAMNDEETVALIAGGHTFGKAHGAADPSQYVGPEPEGAGIEQQSQGWQNSFGSGKGVHAISSGLEGAWTANPIAWDHSYFDNLFAFDWVKTKSPAGATQWVPANGAAADTVPDAHDASKKHAPIMFTTDLALKLDPVYAPISQRFHQNPQELAAAFAQAWYKLTHRDMGPRSRYHGALVPAAPQLWQAPVPDVTHALIGEAEIASLKALILASNLSLSQLVVSAWTSAATFRQSDKRGGANGARIRLAPQKDWAANEPEQLQKVLSTLEGIQQQFNRAQADGKQVSLADLIVLGGCAAIEQAAKNAGHIVQVPFSPGRTDALQEQTDVESFAVLEPVADGFRNYLTPSLPVSAEELLVQTAQRLSLSAPEMTVLVGGMRVLNANFDNSPHGVLTTKPGSLSNDFFVNLLDMQITWAASNTSADLFEGRERKSGTLKWLATRVDLIFGSNSQLRALAEVYASDDAQQKFVRDFVAAWGKVMNLDRFDLS